MNSKRELPANTTGTPGEGVEFWRRIAVEQQGTIEWLEQQLKRQQERIEQLEAEIRAHKKLKGKPQLKASQLNQSAKQGEKAESSWNNFAPAKRNCCECWIVPVCRCTIMPQKPIFESLSPVARSVGALVLMQGAKPGTLLLG